MKYVWLKYIEDTTGLTLEIKQTPGTAAKQLPMYLAKAYDWHYAELAERPCWLAEVSEPTEFGMAQIAKHLQIARDKFQEPVIAIFSELEAYNRKRLIEKRAAFIVPGVQMYIPDFLIDLKEFGNNPKKVKEELTPIAQVLLIMYILDKENRRNLQNKTFKELAETLETNPMGITRAVETMEHNSLVETKGEREKRLHFQYDRKAIWRKAREQKILIDPVLKRVFVDELPKIKSLLHSYTSALPEYSDMNPGKVEYFAIEKNLFYEWQKANAHIHLDEREGRYCLEVWKYSPKPLASIALKTKNVDPISLYLTLIDLKDERIEMALENIEKEYIW